LRAKTDTGWIAQPSARPARSASSTVFLFRTDSTPGIPRQTGQTLVFGVSPKRVGQPQKIFVCVRSWQWTSSPMTASYSITPALFRVGTSGTRPTGPADYSTGARATPSAISDITTGAG
jgi:hypothetical protein